MSILKTKTILSAIAFTFLFVPSAVHAEISEREEFDIYCELAEGPVCCDRGYLSQCNSQPDGTWTAYICNLNKPCGDEPGTEEISTGLTLKECEKLLDRI